MPLARADELDARPADNAKELLALDVDALAQEIRRVDGSNSLGAGALAEELIQFIVSRLSARQQASVEEVARIFRNQLLQLDLECGERVNIHDAIAKLRGDVDVGAAIVLVAEVATWAADALLAKYDIFEKVEG